MRSDPATPRGRGAMGNLPNRFEALHLERDVDWDPERDPQPRTLFLKDSSSSILSHNESPDVGFETTLNPYRGCEHGCSYCYARPTHEYLGFSAGLDFESRIMVKENAPALLRAELLSCKWQPRPIGFSGVTDCYQPVERRLKITRGCLEVLAEFRNPVSIITKNFLVTRDVDLLGELARHKAAMVMLSINALDSDLARNLEPRAASPRQRLEAIERLAKAGIPAGVLVAPIIPGLNDHELPAVLAAAAQAGAGWAYMEMLRLPLGVAPLFEQWLERTVPEKKEKILGRIRAMRGGKLNDSRFGSRMRGEGLFAEQIHQMFQVARRKAGLAEEGPSLSATGFRRPQGPQLALGL